MSERYPAFGTLVKLGSAALAGSPTYTTIPGNTSVPYPQPRADRLNATAHDTTGGYKEYRAGLKDLPEGTFDIFWDPTNAVHADIRSLVGTGTKRAVKVFAPATISPADVATFEAEVVGWAPAAPVEGMLTVTVTIQATSAPTYGTS